jgi:hypothetical protein
MSLAREQPTREIEQNFNLVYSYKRETRVKNVMSALVNRETVIRCMIR